MRTWGADLDRTPALAPDALTPAAGVRRDLVARNVARLTTTPAGPMRQSRALTADQARTLVDAAPGERFEAA
jgi:hypothetical protein